MIGQWVRRLVRRVRNVDSAGAQGERLAAGHLKKQGYRILASNLRLAGGEIDILALSPDGRTVAVVEVKTSITHALPELRVDAGKQRRLAQSAVVAARRFKLMDRIIRFDVIAVVLPRGDAPLVIRHIPGAFESRY